MSRYTALELLRIAAPLVLAATIAVAGPAHSQQGQVCGNRDVVIAVLGVKYNEVRKFIGVTPQSNLFEIFVSPSGSFTSIITNPYGLSCAVVTGEGWQEIIPPSKIGEPL